VQAVAQSCLLQAVLAAVAEGEPQLFNHLYVRKVSPGDHTDIHSDHYRFMDCQRPVCTVWVPLMKQYIEEGTIGFIPGSHLLDLFPAIRGCELPQSYNSIKDNCSWETARFELGDCVVFDSRCIHGSFINCSSLPRISFDFRFSL